jgi:hypothetical protein
MQNERFYSQQQQQSQFNIESSRPVRTSALIMPDQGRVPLMMPAPSAHTTSRSFHSFQQIMPTSTSVYKQSSQASPPQTTRSRSYENSQADVSYATLHQHSPLKVTTGSPSFHHSAKELNTSSWSPPHQNSASPSAVSGYDERFHSPTRRSNYSFERYQQSIGVVSPGTQFRPFETRGGNDFFSQKFKKYAGSGSKESTHSPPLKTFSTTFTQQQQQLGSQRQPVSIELVRGLAPMARLREGDLFKLELEVRTSGEQQQAQVAWYKDGMLLRDSADSRMLTTGYGSHALIIPRVFREHSGVYKALVTCYTSTGGQQLDTSCQLIVEGVYPLLHFSILLFAKKRKFSFVKLCPLPFFVENDFC